MTKKTGGTSVAYGNGKGQGGGGGLYSCKSRGIRSVEEDTKMIMNFLQWLQQS